MVIDSTKGEEMGNLAPLLPERHPQAELFICDIADAAFKSDLASMEHPVFVLPKQPVTDVQRYENGPNWLEITPSVIGCANIWDKDILIFAISQIIAAREAGRPYGKEVSFTAYDFLVFSNRKTDGRAYAALKDALTRLRGTTITTNVRTGSKEQTTGFGLIQEFKIHKESANGRIVEWGITLNDWLFNAIEAHEVLTLDTSYFRLRKPLERRIYEIARKHCGHQRSWKISVPKLQLKCGSTSPKKHFVYMLSQLVENDHLPQYAVSMHDGMVTFTNRKVEEESRLAVIETQAIRLQGETHHQARQVAPGWDIYYLESEWRGWMSMMESRPKNPDKAFIGFCRKWFEKRGRP